MVLAVFLMLLGNDVGTRQAVNLDHENTLEERNRACMLSICPLQGPCRFVQCVTSSCD